MPRHGLQTPLGVKPIKLSRLALSLEFVPRPMGKRVKREVSTLRKARDFSEVEKDKFLRVVHGTRRRGARRV